MDTAQEISRHAEPPTTRPPGMRAAGVERSSRIVPAKSQVVDLPIVDPSLPRPALTARERDVLLCWLTSDSKTAVSTALGLSDGTVKTHLQRIRGKYEAVGRNASTKAALVARALQDGLIGLDDL